MPSGFRLRVALVGMFFSACVGCGPRFGLPSLCDPRRNRKSLPRLESLIRTRSRSQAAVICESTRPQDFIDPRADPDLLAKQQMMIPSNVVATPVAPGGLPAPPAVYIPSSPTYPPGAAGYPPATAVPPPGTSMMPVATPQVVYPAATSSYAPGSTMNPVAAAVYPASVPTSYTVQPAASVSTGASTTVSRRPTGRRYPRRRQPTPSILDAEARECLTYERLLVFGDG